MSETMGIPPVPPQFSEPATNEVEENPPEEIWLKPGFYNLSNVEYFRDGVGTEPLTNYTEGTMTIFKNGGMSFDGFVGTDPSIRFPVRGWKPVKVDGERITFERRSEPHLPDAIVVVDAKWFKDAPF